MTERYRKLWFRPSRAHDLGTAAFGLAWFSIILLPVVMVLSSIGLLGLLMIGSDLAAVVFRSLWVLAACTYVYSIVLSVQLDPAIGRKTWREAILFPGLLSMVVMLAALFPGLFERVIPDLLGLTVPAGLALGWTIFVYSWISLSMFFGWMAKLIEKTAVGRFVTPALVYLVGYGPILCAITVDSYIKEALHAESHWDKTEKTGRVGA